jgi:hypothetical protein
LAAKFIDGEKVLATKTKGLDKDQILVKLRTAGKPPQWVKMSLAEYEQKAVIREGFVK